MPDKRKEEEISVVSFAQMDLYAHVRFATRSAHD